MAGPHLNIVLLEPRIPNNTGNIGRTAVVSGCRLHLVHPLGFDLDEKSRRRAGLDYWHLLDWRQHADWEAFLASERPSRLVLLTKSASRSIHEASFQEGDYLLFGSEDDGVSSEVREDVLDRWGPRSHLGIPMVDDPGARSLNLATAVAIAVYEGIRQIGAVGKDGKIT